MKGLPGANTFRSLAELGAAIDLDGGSRRTLARDYAMALIQTRVQAMGRNTISAHCCAIERLIAGHLDRGFASTLYAILEQVVVPLDVPACAAEEILSMWRRLIDDTSREARIYDILTKLPLAQGGNLYAMGSFRTAAAAILRGGADTREKVSKCFGEALNEIISCPQLFAMWVDVLNEIQTIIPELSSPAPEGDRLPVDHSRVVGAPTTPDLSRARKQRLRVILFAFASLVAAAAMRLRFWRIANLGRVAKQTPPRSGQIDMASQKEAAVRGAGGQDRSSPAPLNKPSLRRDSPVAASGNPQRVD